jgi:NAD(P)-dependent dehydrogenase (short-subunit alcohol dehydrogenase family)
MSKTALVTGASSGFGLLTTITLAKQGWRVLATMRDLARRERLENAAQEAGVLDLIEFITLDVTNNDQIGALAARLAARPTPLDALINNAGFAMAGFADDISDHELRQQFDTNFFGATALTRAVLPLMRKQGFGHIVFLSSISGRCGFPFISSYSASKFAIEGWAESLRLELKPLGLQVALVEPGVYDTNIWTTGAFLSKQTQLIQAQAADPKPASKSKAHNAHSSNAARIPGMIAHINTPKPRANPQRL